MNFIQTCSIRFFPHLSSTAVDMLPVLLPPCSMTSTSNSEFPTLSYFIYLYDITLRHRSRNVSTHKDFWSVINVQAVNLSKTLDLDFYFSAFIAFFHLILDFIILQIHCIWNFENPLLTKTTFPHSTSFILTESATGRPLFPQTFIYF